MCPGVGAFMKRRASCAVMVGYGLAIQAQLVDHEQIGDKNDGHLDGLQPWLADRDLMHNAVRDLWAASLGDEAAGAAQQEYDSTPELRDLLNRAAASGSVVRSRRGR